MVRLFAALLTLTFAFVGFGTQLGDKDGFSSRTQHVISADITPSGAAPPLPSSSLNWSIVALDDPSSDTDTPFTRREGFSPRTIFRNAPKRPPPRSTTLG